MTPPMGIVNRGGPVFLDAESHPIRDQRSREIRKFRKNTIGNTMQMEMWYFSGVLPG